MENSLAKQHLAPTHAHADTDTPALLARFLSTRARTETLAAPVSEVLANAQAMPDASPLKWHLAHSSWFFETFILSSFVRGYQVFNAEFKVLFNSYYNAVGDKHPRNLRGEITKPDLAMVMQYRHYITASIRALLERADTTLTAEAIALLWLGCNHEEQHQELILTDLKYLLAQQPSQPAYQPRWLPVAVEMQSPHWHRYDGGLVEMGHQSKHFAFDNELPRHRVFLETFELAAYPVSHGDFAEFIAAGGYSRSDLWLSLGWDWVNSNQISAPLYWQNNGTADVADWHTFTLHGVVPIEANTPVCHISYFEADAFARWSGARLPTEAEWEHAAAQVEVTGNFIESGALHPLALQKTSNHSQPQQLFGDVWEWTASAYLPYPKFKTAEGAVGEYNGKFMCNQLVLHGGSCATPQAHIRASYRNFFPPDARWQFSGLRLARDV